MTRSDDRLPQWVFHLAASFIFGAVFLRALLFYLDEAELGRVLGLLLIWMALFTGERALLRWSSDVFPVYLVVQTTFTFVLMGLYSSADFLALLTSMLSMQVMLRLEARIGRLWIGMCTAVMALLLLRAYGSQAIALVLIYTAANVFLGAYAQATRQAREARYQTQLLAQELREGNQALQAYVSQMEGMAVARERHRLANDLHDAVTQTVFSMNLTAQSALLLLHRDSPKVFVQLERLRQLAQSALSEMELLISELRPEKMTTGGLASALRQYLANGRLSESLSVTVEIDGDAALDPAEEQGLFRIVQEALNNVVKHAQASRASVRLHLAEPLWIEVEDQGRGFDLRRAQHGSGVGLTGMRERAAEIGWHLQISTAPGAGTRIRLEKIPGREVQR